MDMDLEEAPVLEDAQNADGAEDKAPRMPHRLSDSGQVSAFFSYKKVSGRPLQEQCHLCKATLKLKLATQSSSPMLHSAGCCIRMSPFEESTLQIVVPGFSHPNNYHLF